MNRDPTGFIVIIKLNDYIPGIIVDRVVRATDVFKKRGFEVSFLSIPTVNELVFTIRSKIQAYPKSCCHYVGFFFIGDGVVDPYSYQLHLKLCDGILSVQRCMDLINLENTRRHPLKFMFFFDCHFLYDKIKFNKPLAFNLPPRSIVVFATSPGQKYKDDDKDKAGYLIRWSNELCEQLENVQKGQTLTEVLELTNEKVIKMSSDFKQHPPQFFSSAGPIVLKGIHDELLRSFKNYKNKLIEHISGLNGNDDDNDVLVGLTAVLHFEGIINNDKKDEIVKMKGRAGAECLLNELEKVCQIYPAYTETVVDLMKGEKILQHTMEKIEEQKANIVKTTNLSYKDLLDDYEIKSDQLEDLKIRRLLKKR